MFVIVLILFLLFPVFSIPLIILGLLLDEKHNKLYAALFTVWISIILYYLVPDFDMDLYRYYSYMDSVKNIDIPLFINTIIVKTEPLAYSIMYFFAKLNNNSLIMVFTTFLSYSIIFYIMYDYMKEKKITKLEKNIIVIYVLCTFLVIANITGLRLCIARLIFILGLYLDFFKGKKNIFILLLYILPIFIHTSAFLLVVIRVVMFLNKNKFNMKYAFLIFIISLSPNLLINLASKVINISFLASLSSRAEIYLANYYSGMSNIYLLQIALMFFMLISTIYLKRTAKNYNEKFINFSLIILIIALAYITTSAISTRFIVIAITNSIIINLDLIEKVKGKNKLFFMICLISFSIVYFVYQVILFKDVIGYGNLFNENILKNIITIFNK